MVFVDDVAQREGCSWLKPAPIGTVEDGWVEIVADLLREIDAVVSARPGITLDVLGVGERDGELLFDAVVDGLGAGDDVIAVTVAAAVDRARTRAAATCTRCGRPGRLRLDRPAWPGTRCQDHAPGGPPS